MGIIFGCLCKEIRRATAQHEHLESKHTHQLSLLASAKGRNIAALGRELEDVRAGLAAKTKNTNAAKAILRGLEAFNVDLSMELAKMQQVMDQLDVKEDLKLESTRQKMKELELENVKIHGKIEGLRATLKEKEQELLDKEGYSQGKLLVVQEALDREQNSLGGVGQELLDEERYSQGELLKVQEALKRERNFLKRIERDAINANIKLLIYKDCICREEFKRSCTVREKDMVISDLKIKLISKEKYSEDF